MTLSQKEQLFLASKDQYYNGTPINLKFYPNNEMTDFEFDILEEELRQLGSPVIKKVGSGVRQAVKHEVVQKSLAKIQVLIENQLPTDQFSKWVIDQFSKLSVRCTLECTPKLDGNSASVKYVNGKLVSGLSRGNGEEGMDITDKMKQMVPHTINFKGEIIIKGEVVVDKKIFAKKYSQYANPRNFVAGKLNPEAITEKEILKDLTFVGYEAMVKENGHWHYIDMFTEKELYSKFNFPFAKYYNINNKNIESTFNDAYEVFKDFRKNCQFQLDGFVFKFRHNDLHSVLETMGETSHHPHWAVAIKFIPEEAITTLKGISWTVGKTGKLTPTAILEPVLLDGSTISAASLHNWRYLFTNKCFPGTKVVIAKKGDIIPQVIKINSVSPDAAKYEANPTLLYPKEFDASLISETDVNLMLNDDNAIALKRLQLAVAFLGIDDLGPSTVEKLFNEGVKTIEDFFTMNLKKKLEIVFSNTDSSMPTKIMANFNKITEMEYWKTFYLLQIDNCGQTVSKALAEMLTGVRPATDKAGLNKSIVEMMMDDNSPERLRQKNLTSILEAKGIKIVNPVKLNLTGMTTFEMTGSPTTHKTKEEFLNAVKDFAVHTKLNADTHYLVTNDTTKMGGKMDKALKLKTRIITYDDFLKLA